MFRRRRRGTVIAEGLKIAGNVSAEGFVELHGEIEGELHCSSLSITRKGRITGKIIADDVAINGTVEGPIDAGYVSLQSKARVTGDIHHKSFAIEKGAYFNGRSIQKEDSPKDKPVRQLTAKDAAGKVEKNAKAKETAEIEPVPVSA